MRNTGNRLKIGFGSWADGTFATYTEDMLGSGYENIAWSLDKTWHRFIDKINEDYDIVILCAPGAQDVIKKPANWKKLYILEEAGYGIVNTHWYYEKLLDIDCDGFLVHSKKLIPNFEAICKPVYHFYPPYPLAKVRKYKTDTFTKTIALNMSRVQTSDANITGTIRLCQLLPEYNFITYCGDSEYLNRVAKKAGVNNWFIHSDIDFHKYLEIISSVGLGVSLDNRDTWGRFQLDLYALGKKCVGVYTGTQELLYPKEYMVDRSDVYKLVDLVREHFGTKYDAVPQENCISHNSFRRFVQENL